MRSRVVVVLAAVAVMLAVLSPVTSSPAHARETQGRRCVTDYGLRFCIQVNKRTTTSPATVNGSTVVYDIDGGVEWKVQVTSIKLVEWRIVCRDWDVSGGRPVPVPVIAQGSTPWRTYNNRLTYRAVATYKGTYRDRVFTKTVRSRNPENIC